MEVEMSKWSIRLAEQVTHGLSGLAGTRVIGGDMQEDSARFDFESSPKIDERDFSQDVGYPARVQGHSLFVYKYDNYPRSKR